MKILLATDGSDTARAALDYLLAFPLPSDTELTVLTVIREIIASDQVAQLSEEHRRAFTQARKEADSEAKALIDEEVERIRQAGLSAKGEVRSGHPSEEIVRLALERHSDVIAVGSHGRSGVKRFLLGSTSDRVFEYAPCSVLVVKHPAATDGIDETALPETDGKWRLLLAYDDSPPARKAVELCASLPLAGKAEVRAITVMPLIHMYRQDIRLQLNWMWQEKKHAAQTALERVAAQIGGKNVEVSTQLIEGTNTAQEILDAATGNGDDLIILGHKGKKAFERFLLGSVTARIAHHAPCSVLSVRSGE